MSKYGIPGLDTLRSKSPTDKGGRGSSVTLDERNPIYVQAMTSLYDAAWKFDREKNGDLLKVSISVFYRYVYAASDHLLLLLSLLLLYLSLITIP